MKAFYRWWKTYKQKWSLNEHYAREGWKAALEWVLKHDPDIGIAGCIRKELEEK